ncbi:hypothetical protein [Janthinobacterium lividum]|uniref:Uncharacterized protein n=1 Tax=Janthinobacterium lividum TaxID=29581 RepID=A0ABU0XTH2_9BURK|nr:hypothetical protein [Janthinobacterium lividum]MDQ4626274.1 hypothetical protein [Janthinobacterium lividum]MDQ4674759.1 hypothetical protein [Janthinobacterium lividum]MDQ4685491.1 hypothetical protein [Janthinobacterium lividum]
MRQVLGGIEIFGQWRNHKPCALVIYFGRSAAGIESPRTLFGGRIRPLALAMAATTVRPVAAAHVAVVSCPQAIPSSWNLPAARFDGVRMLSHPANQPPANAEALPIPTPSSEGTRAGTERYLRMDLPRVKQCIVALEQRTKMVRFQCK